MTRRNLKVPIDAAPPSGSRPNVFDPNCDSRQVLALITHRWTVLVIYALGVTTRRHSELKAMIGGVSQKMLTQTLRQLHLPEVRLARGATAAPPDPGRA